MRTLTSPWQNIGVDKKITNFPNAIGIYYLNPYQHFPQFHFR
jgi:hypothetical protein